MLISDSQIISQFLFLACWNFPYAYHTIHIRLYVEAKDGDVQWKLTGYEASSFATQLPFQTANSVNSWNAKMF